MEGETIQDKYKAIADEVGITVEQVRDIAEWCDTMDIPARRSADVVDDDELPF